MEAVSVLSKPCRHQYVWEALCLKREPISSYVTSKPATSAYAKLHLGVFIDQLASSDTTHCLPLLTTKQ